MEDLGRSRHSRLWLRRDKFGWTKIEVPVLDFNIDKLTDPSSRVKQCLHHQSIAV